MSMDQDSLLRLLLAHRAMLIGYITSIVRDPHLAEDVFQDVSLIILKKGHTVADERGFPPWARQVARLEALNAYRQAKRAPQPLGEEVLASLDAEWEAEDASAHPTETRDALRACLNKLTPRARRIVALRYDENLSGRNLARRLARPLNTVYVALSRIHRTLAACVKTELTRS